MKAIVVYGSRYGNTEKVAAAIASGLRRFGAVDIYPVDRAPLVIAKDVDLFVIGGPTEAHHMTPAVKSYLAHLESTGLSGRRAAAFDTRVRWPRALSGSAAADITRSLRAAGAEIAADPTSFFVRGKDPELDSGEAERAEIWAASLFMPVATGVGG